MGKYNSWALAMDREFKAAREKYLDAYNRFLAAKDALEHAKDWREGDNDNVRTLRSERATLEFKEAQNSLDAVAESAWNGFYQQCNNMRADLVRNMQGDNVANPNAVDNNALELMKTGVLSAADYVAFANKYADNATMLKLIAHYAAEAAKNTDDKKESGTLNTVALACKDGQNATMRAWDELASIANRCSGRRANGSCADHGVCAVMAEKWEELSGDAIKNF